MNLWIKLFNRIVDLMNNEDKRMQQHLLEFLLTHKDAPEIITDKNGKPTAAIYFTLHGRNKEHYKNIMRNIKEQTLYAYEMDEND